MRHGRLNRDCDPGALSEYVFTLLQGLRVRSRTSSETADLDRTITTAIRVVFRVKLITGAAAYKSKSDLTQRSDWTPTSSLRFNLARPILLY